MALPCWLMALVHNLLINSSSTADEAFWARASSLDAACHSEEDC